MKFYYNNKLVRTSKTHEYKYALIWEGTGNLVMCSATREGCEKEIKSRIGHCREAIENYENIIKAINNGSKKFLAKAGRKSFYIDIPVDSVEKCKEYIGHEREKIEAYIRKMKIVELEVRA